MEQYRPLEGMELTQIEYIHFLHSVMKGDESLKGRFSSIGKWWRYKGLVKQLGNLFGEIWVTIPPEVRDRINSLWAEQELVVQNKNRPIGYTNGDMLYIPKSSLMYMAQDLQKERCSMCFGGHQDRKDCKFRRAMLGLALPDLRREEKRCGKCVGHIFDWGNDNV
jgi:hypothetical protein